jgi:hypothetical protein
MNVNQQVTFAPIILVPSSIVLISLILAIIAVTVALATVLYKKKHKP